MGIDPMKQKRSSGLLSKYDVFIFDWDGTLNNMRGFLKFNEGVKRALGLWNKDSSIKDFRHINYNLKNKLKQEERVNSFFIPVVDLIFKLSKPKLQNSALELLSTLKKNRKKIALFTNGNSHRVIQELKYLGVDNYFDVIVSARDLKTMKPNPSGLKAILYELAKKPQNAIYIGDMIDDIIAAKRAHVHSCAVADGFDSYHKLKSINPEYIFKSVEALNDAL
jgi:HAD superfamily hydrolase (TIGR01509 family)